MSEIQIVTEKVMVEIGEVKTSKGPGHPLLLREVSDEIAELSMATFNLSLKASLGTEGCRGWKITGSQRDLDH